MTIEYINVGAAPNDGQGDPIRTAFIKCNNDFAELNARAQPFPPVTLVGHTGDQAGMYAYDSAYFYYCYSDYDGSSIIWAKIAQLSNIAVNNIINGNSSVSIPEYNGNVIFAVNGVGNVLTVNTNGIVVNSRVTTQYVNASGFTGNTANVGNIRIYDNYIVSNNGLINVNLPGTTSDFAVNGGNANLLFVDGSMNSVSVGSDYQTFGATFAVNATDSMLLPVGNSYQRPANPKEGMLRFNTVTNTAEVFNGATWVEIGSPNYTIITDDRFVGDGIHTTFVLNTKQSTYSCIVSINGIVQVPVEAYNVNGTILEFSDPPEYGDYIDVRGIMTPDITNDSLLGDGITASWNLGTQHTSESTIVSINGIVQTPETISTPFPSKAAYRMINETILFAQAPQEGDIINIRGYPGTEMNISSYIGTGSQNLFVLPEPYTTVSCIVLVNGILQLPGPGAGYSYNIAGTSLVFDQAPHPGDAVEVREFTVVSRNGLYNSSGNASVVVSETDAEVDVTGNLVVSGNILVGNVFNTNASGVGNIGSRTGYYNRVFGNAFVSMSSGVAENFVTDALYPPGTVLSFGGTQELTVSTVDADPLVAGIVAYHPAVTLNADLLGAFVAPLALSGRAQCMVQGNVARGDTLVSAGNGFARSEATPIAGTIVGKALEAFTGTTGTIDIIVGY